MGGGHPASSVSKQAGPSDGSLVSMPTALEELESAALDLPEHDRARLAHRLIESLEDDPAEDVDHVRRHWIVEIERRVAEYRAGESRTVPAAEVFAEAYARLRSDR